MLGREDAVAIPSKPTHVVVSPTPVRDSADAKSPLVTELAAGTQVHLVETTEGWVLVARGGRVLRYVVQQSLLRLQ